MTPLNSIVDIANAASAFAMKYGQNVPEATSQAGLSGSPHDLLATAISKFAPGNSAAPTIAALAEVLYAFREDITDAATKTAAMTLCGQAAMFAAVNNWITMGDVAVAGGPTRGVGICWAMQRELGETAPAGTAWPAASADPAVAPQFLAQKASITTANMALPGTTVTGSASGATTTTTTTGGASS